MYVGRDVPIAGYDGWAVRLRLVSDGVPVQLFRSIAPVQTLLGLQPRPGPDWWAEFAKVSARVVQEVVEGGSFTPLADSAAMVDIRPDMDEVAERSRQPNPYRRHLPVDPPLSGVEVGRFGPGFVDRRTQPRI